MKKILVYCMLVYFIFISGCRYSECTQNTLNHCMEGYFNCLRDQLDDGCADRCLGEYCLCLEQYNCDNKCEYKKACLKHEESS